MKKKESPYAPNKDLTLILPLNPDILTREMKEHYKSVIPEALDRLGDRFSLEFEMMICIPQDGEDTSYFLEVISHNYHHEFLKDGIVRNGFLKTFELKDLTAKQKDYFLTQAFKYICIYAINYADKKEAHHEEND